MSESANATLAPGRMELLDPKAVPLNGRNSWAATPLLHAISGTNDPARSMSPPMCLHFQRSECQLAH